MSRSQFRWLLVVYLVLVVVDLVTDGATKSMIPDFVAKAERSEIHAQFAPQGISAGTVIIGCMLVSVVAAALVGIAGMFWFWRPGLYLFLLSVCARVIAYPFCWTWHVETGWVGFVGSLGTMLEGIIFALVFFGPAKPLFFREKSPTMRSSELPSAGAAGIRSP